MRDDGRGFDASRATTLAGGHFGWLGMRERAERIGASLVLDSRPGAGTRVVARIENIRMRVNAEPGGEGAG